MKIYPYKILALLSFSVVLSPIQIQANNCTCEIFQYGNQNKHESLKYKIGAIASILIASFTGVSIPLFLKNASYLQPNSAPHFLIKSFAAGVILATGFLHILPDAFESLTSPCLSEKPWGEFPFAGFVAMMTAIATLMMETLSTGYHERAELRKAQPLDGNVTDATDEETATPGHVHGPAASIMLQKSDPSNIRNRIVSQVLELGIVVHSVVIGISLGATESPKTIKPLIAALSFHQFFEGMGLGSCISQAKFKAKSVIIMVLFFSLTTPSGIAIGIGISSVYNEQSPTALIVEGILDSASAGILIYMALVDLLAADFMNMKLLTNFKLQIWTSFALLMGASCMAVLARWGGA